jgi:hypothetical protein
MRAETAGGAFPAIHDGAESKSAAARASRADAAAKVDVAMRAAIDRTAG